MICPLCTEPVTDGDTVRDLMTEDGPRLAHRECMLRSVLGGIGHFEDHRLWCNERGDPDGGRTYRQSALEVDEWVRQHGI